MNNLDGKNVKHTLDLKKKKKKMPEGSSRLQNIFHKDNSLHFQHLKKKMFRGEIL